MHAFGVASVVEKLRAAGGGYEIVHDSPGLELGVYRPRRARSRRAAAPRG